MNSDQTTRATGLDTEPSGYVETLVGPDGSLREYVRLVDHDKIVERLVKSRCAPGPAN